MVANVYESIQLKTMAVTTHITSTCGTQRRRQSVWEVFIGDEGQLTNIKETRDVLIGHVVRSYMTMGRRVDT